MKTRVFFLVCVAVISSVAGYIEGSHRTDMTCDGEVCAHIECEEPIGDNEPHLEHLFDGLECRAILKSQAMDQCDEQFELDMLIASVDTVKVGDIFNTKNFPAAFENVADPSLYEFVVLDKETVPIEVVRKMDRLGLRPGTMRELLTYLAANPDDSLESGIFAFGSSWLELGPPQKYRRLNWLVVPYVATFRDFEDSRPERAMTISVGYDYESWSPGERFLAVPK